MGDGEKDSGDKNEPVKDIPPPEFELVQNGVERPRYQGQVLNEENDKD